MPTPDRGSLRRMLVTEPSVPVIICTGAADQALARDGVRLGALGFIVKPFSRDTVLGAVRHAPHPSVVLRHATSEPRPQSRQSEVEQTFDLRSQLARRVGALDLVRLCGTVLELSSLAERLGQDPGSPTAAVVVWAAGRRRAFALEELVGQLQLERLHMPYLACGDFAGGGVLLENEVIPIVEPGAIVGDCTVGGGAKLGFTDLQQSALREVANIGSGHAATALSQLLGVGNRRPRRTGTRAAASAIRPRRGTRRSSAPPVHGRRTRPGAP